MTAVATSRSAPEVLEWSRALVDPVLRAAVDQLPDLIRHIAGYHLGWWDERGKPTNPGGKAIRPALTMLSARAAGSVEAAVPAAAAVEMVHNFTLLHDDVMDRDRTRRHRPAAWWLFGTGQAILTGDALLTKAFELLGNGPEAAGVFSATLIDLMHGQSLDLAFEQSADIDLARCTAMASAKTGALLGCACALGALFAGGTDAQVTHLRGFGERLGLVFQLVDDLLGIWGDPAVTGKPVHSDLARRKKSLPVVAALTSGTPEGRALAATYHSETDLVRLADLVEAAGGRSWAQARAEDELAQALSHLEAVAPPPQAAAELRALALHLTQRDR